MLYTKPQAQWAFGSGETDFLKGFYHKWKWPPSWSYDPDVANKLLFPLFIKAPCGFVWPSGFGGEDIWSIFPIWMYEKQVTTRVGPFLTPGL